MLGRGAVWLGDVAGVGPAGEVPGVCGEGGERGDEGVQGCSPGLYVQGLHFVSPTLLGSWRLFTLQPGTKKGAEALANVWMAM